MQITVKDIKVKEGLVKAGRNEGKPWKLIILIGEDGTEFTTFDASAQEVGVGGVIELEPIIKAGKINFTEFSIISKGQAPPPPSTNGKPDMTPDMWAEKDKYTRLSIESQVAFKGVMEAFTAGKLDKDLILVRAALDWAMIRLGGQVLAAKPARKAAPADTGQPSEASEVDLCSMVFANAGEVKTAMKDKLNMDGLQIAAATGGWDLTAEGGRIGCWADILKTREE